MPQKVQNTGFLTKGNRISPCHIRTYIGLGNRHFLLL